ncbi:MAG: hypothetical protein D6B28_08415 [Gammaproteobacteria bacterium]|nr:MAG: hypothetical protein D6B28_08415 [Gammaproteobacteria bacterium]
MTDRVSNLLNALFAIAFITAIAWIITPSILDYFYRNDQIITIAAEFNRSSSINSHRDFKFTKAEAGRGKCIIYNYTLANYNASEVDPYALQTETRPKLLEDIREDSRYKQLRDLNADMVFIYHSNDDIEITRIEITPQDYSS